MNSFKKLALTAILLATSLNSQAQRDDTTEIAGVIGGPVEAYYGTVFDASYGADQYQTRYEIGDLLNSVAEDIAKRLERFLDRDLREKERQSAEARTQQLFIVSAY